MDSESCSHSLSGFGLGCPRGTAVTILAESAGTAYAKWRLDVTAAFLSI